MEVMTSGRQGNAHHGLAAHEMVLLLESDPHRGLTGAEARSRRGRYGTNALPRARRAGPLARVLHQVTDPLIYVLVAAGAVTELGEIHRLVGTAQLPVTPLTRKLARFSKVLTVVILALAAVAFAAGLARGEKASEMFTAAVALAVGAIPEGLPAAVTITLAIGVGRMARRRAVIRRLPAVETLGSTTVICSDKTGTLTQNQMTVRAVRIPDGRYDVTGAGYLPDGAITGAAGRAADLAADETLRWCLLAGAGCNDAVLDLRDGRPALTGDPTEAALLVSAGKAGLDQSAVTAAFPRVDVVTFSSERRYMATLHEHHADGRPRYVVFAKGAAALVWRVLLVSALLVAGAWWLFEWEKVGGAGEAEARTAAVNLFVMVELFYLFSCRSLTGSAWRAGLFTNRWIAVGVTAQVAGQLALTYLPALNRLFQTAPITGGAWLRILILALAASLIVAADKRLTRGARDALARRQRGGAAPGGPV
ncbi:MAG TPA: HAD-IC family P-type ATPase [Streptosporangiaceae bacterium]|nr:HAD-IC family P-type ATPase [Streptosporangiaceae bacterium]